MHSQVMINQVQYYLAQILLYLMGAGLFCCESKKQLKKYTHKCMC